MVADDKDLSYCEREIVKLYNFHKVSKMVAGGRERQNSVYNGIVSSSGKSDIVLIHDGARPFITEDIIERSINEAQHFGAVCVAVPVKDTIKSCDLGGFVKKTLDRNTLWAVQTPQVFKRELIIKAHDKALIEGFIGTDDTVLVERLNAKVKIVLGSYDNIKITTVEDLAIGEAILRANKERNS